MTKDVRRRRAPLLRTHLEILGIKTSIRDRRNQMPGRSPRKTSREHIAPPAQSRRRRGAHCRSPRRSQDVGGERIVALPGAVKTSEGSASSLSPAQSRRRRGAHCRSPRRSQDVGGAHRSLGAVKTSEGSASSLSSAQPRRRREAHRRSPRRSQDVRGAHRRSPRRNQVVVGGAHRRTPRRNFRQVAQPRQFRHRLFQGVASEGKNGVRPRGSLGRQVM